jgi:DNA-binding response OmpR family regulator
MSKKKVLLVEDELDFLTLMKKIITSWGYEVITASNSKEALEVFVQERPNILILDYVMPDINGLELLRKIRAIGGIKTPAIMFAAEPTVKAIEKGEELRIAAFIPKISRYVDTHEDLKIALDLISKETR